MKKTVRGVVYDTENSAIPPAMKKPCTLQKTVLIFCTRTAAKHPLILPKN